MNMISLALRMHETTQDDPSNKKKLWISNGDFRDLSPQHHQLQLVKSIRKPMDTLCTFWTDIMHRKPIHLENSPQPHPPLEASRISYSCSKRSCDKFNTSIELSCPRIGTTWRLLGFTRSSRSCAMYLTCNMAITLAIEPQEQPSLEHSLASNRGWFIENLTSPSYNNMVGNSTSHIFTIDQPTSDLSSFEHRRQEKQPWYRKKHPLPSADHLALGYNHWVDHHSGLLLDSGDSDSQYFEKGSRNL